MKGFNLASLKSLLECLWYRHPTWEDFMADIDYIHNWINGLGSNFLYKTGSNGTASGVKTLLSKLGGTKNQFIKADGSIDSTVYSSKDHTHTEFTTIDNHISNLYSLGGVKIVCIISNKVSLCSYQDWVKYKNTSTYGPAIGIYVPIEGHRPIILGLKAPGSLNGFLSFDSTDLFSTADEALADYKRNTHRKRTLESDDFLADEAVLPEQSFLPSWLLYYQPEGTTSTWKWWLPTLGELMAINNHFDEINLCLSTIPGAKILDPKSFYISSSPRSVHNGETLLWGILFSNGGQIGSFPYRFGYAAIPVATFNNDALYNMNTDKYEYPESY